jgi:hypothetical protein
LHLNTLIVILLAVTDCWPADLDNAMRCRRSLSQVVATGAIMLALGVQSAVAMDLVPGGYGAETGGSLPSTPLAMQQQFSSSAGNAGLTLDFTPRASGSLFSRPSAASDDDTMSFSLGLQGGYSEELRLDSIGVTGLSDDASEGLALGGALSFNEWELSGSVGRANLLGSDADVFAAGLGYGRLNARLVYGHVPETTGNVGGDLLMLSTDLAAWSWLTLQGDVAVSETLADEPLTVGRIGVRLNF